jgi:lipoate---protein ligase
MLRVLDTGVSAAEENMKFDAQLLDRLDPAGQPILHLYRWDSPSATYGHFIQAGKHLDLEKAALRRVKLARRPTGGGIVFHIWDLAFSFLMPAHHPAFSLNTLDNYQFVNGAVLGAVSELFELKESASLIPESFPSLSGNCRNFCMAKPTQYDVVYKGMKVAGAAQRKTKQGYLHQGTISLAAPHLPLLREVLRSEEAILDAMASYTYAPLGNCWSPVPLEEARQNIQQRLIEKFMEKL